MLTNLAAVLGPAQRGAYAVGSFNVYSGETIRGVIDRAAQLRSPVIVAFGAGYLPNMDLEEVAALVSRRAAAADVPVVLHLDHCRDLGVVEKAASVGFTSVMYDGSHLDFEENVRGSAEAVRFSRALGASVEAELGSLALGAHSNEGGIGDAERYTDPAAAREFVERTGVDALAVSIGTVHGMYRGEPNIRVDLLKRIRAATSVPLVLHGGSGTPEAVLRECIANGICKINVNTEISQRAVADIAALVAADPNVHLSKLCLGAAASVAEVVGKYIALFR